MSDERGDDARVVLVTAPDVATARKLAESVVASRAAACANLLPGVTSIYSWKGRVESDEEVLMIVKTTQARLPELERAITEAHPYEVPEFVVLAASHVAGPYQAWLRAAVESVGGDSSSA
ncbi:MAG: divalent-cation tolerance protein CutA [Planctomycetota bacterium]|jgi:periplasmic divalent cation tolerance protein